MHAALTALMVLFTTVTAAAQSRAASSPRVRVEGVAAWVGAEHPSAILRSDVELRARLLITGRSHRVAMIDLPPGLLAATLEELVGEVLIEREADRLRAARPSPAEVQQWRARLEAEAGGEELARRLITRLGASAEEFSAIAARRAYVDAFLRANLEGNNIITDAQLERAFERGEHPFVGRSLEEVQEVMRAWLARQVLARDVARWIEVLRRRTTVRVLAEWRREQGARR